MSQTVKSASKAKAQINTHHIQFLLVDDKLTAIIEPRPYKISWTPKGEKLTSIVEGTTDAKGHTQLIQTHGQVAVTLEIAPPNDNKCEMIGTTTTRPINKRAEVRVQLQFSGQAVSQVKPSQTCAQLTVREGKQRIQYVINNLSKYKTYANYLKSLPYFIVNADTLEVISDLSEPPKEAPKMVGSNTQVSTAIVSVDGIKRVGLVLGSATDDPMRWREDNKALVFYKVEPKDTGLTQIVINEIGEAGVDFTDATKVTDFKSTLNGNVWAKMCRTYTGQDIKAMLPGGLSISTKTPTEMQIDYALQQGHITQDQAIAYKADRTKRIEAAKKLEPTPKPKAKSTNGTDHKNATAKEQPLPELQYWCSWAELLGPIYTGQIEDGTPPNPQIPVVDPKTKKQKIDPDTKKPLTRNQFSDDKYIELTAQGEGKIIIRPLGLTLELSGVISTGGEPFAQNAQEITELGKAAIMAKTHPFTYLAMLESCHDCGVHYVRIGCTWRPMIGSVFHKLGDAIDIGKIDSENDAAKAFTFLNTKVDVLADKFTRSLNGHRYAKAGSTIYNFDNLPANAPFHDNHLHFTADRLKPVAEQDKTPKR